MSYKIINLWTHPRALSTAFYRVIYEREDFQTIFEPFVHMYYEKVFLKKKACRKDYLNKKYFTKYNKIKNQIIESSYSSNVFVKDMAYCVCDYIDDDYLKNSINIFLIRNPEKSLPSFYHVLKENKYFSDKLIKYLPFQFVKFILLKHTGYSKLWELYKKCCNFHNPLIINAEDFENKSEVILKKFCNYCEIEYINTLTWNKKKIDDFSFAGTSMFHKNISQSTGIYAQSTQYDETIDNNKLLKKIYDYSIVYYNKLHRQSLTN